MISSRSSIASASKLWRVVIRFGGVEGRSGLGVGRSGLLSISYSRWFRRWRRRRWMGYQVTAAMSRQSAIATPMPMPIRAAKERLLLEPPDGIGVAFGS